MSTTTERPFHRVLRRGGYAGLALGGWAAIVIALPFVGPAGRLAAIPGEQAVAVRAVVAAGGQVVAVRDGVVLARSDEAGFARRLYGAGAPIVLEGRIAAGCLDLVS
jgi:hypothetical protein